MIENISEKEIKNNKESIRQEENKKKILNMFARNVTSTRREVLQQMLNPGKDINYECGYPTSITIQNYRDYFDREGLGKRVVSILPEESWAMAPEIYEDEDMKETEFEKDLKALDKERHLLHYLQRIDILSGIGSFGILLLGISDGKKLNEPVDGIDLKTGELVGTPKKYELLYLRPFDESLVKIKETEEDTTAPRFGQPTIYEVNFENSLGTTTLNNQVHWTRVIHIADNRETSEIYGAPRMKSVYNRLLDIRKVLSGSGEMFWKGAFPGYAFEVNPDISDATIDEDTIRDTLEDYTAGLQRYIAIAGVTVKNLEPQISDPSVHVETQLKYIAISLGIPYRIFLGSEQAKLASTQDKETWNKRIAKRQTSYVDPLVIRPLIDRLIIYGILPSVEEYFIDWPDLNAPGEEEGAKIAEIKTNALTKYVAGSVDELIPPKEYLMMILGMDQEEAETIEKAAKLYGTDLSQQADEKAEKEAADAAIAADEATARQIEIERVKTEARNG